MECRPPFFEALALCGNSFELESFRSFGKLAAFFCRIGRVGHSGTKPSRWHINPQSEGAAMRARFPRRKMRCHAGAGVTGSIENSRAVPSCDFAIGRSLQQAHLSDHATRQG